MSSPGFALHHSLLAGIKAAGLSLRTVNYIRSIAVAFLSWCVKRGRAESNPLKVVPRRDESKDRWRVRRPLSDMELATLLDVADARGRKAWYMVAAWAGLRKGDLARLTWADVDFKAGTITVRNGKAKRTDIVPMHPQLAAEFQRRLDANPALPAARVFPTVVTDLTRTNDFLRAGLAHREAVMDDDGEPIMAGKGKRRRPLTRITATDEEGRIIALHAMRTTPGTNLARHGIAPQIAMRIMRHTDYRTTLKHYTVLGITDTAAAIQRLPGLPTGPAAARLAAVGTDDVSPHRHPSSWGAKRCESVRSGAGKGRACGVRGNTRKPRENAGFVERNSDAPGRTRTSNLQIRSLPLCPIELRARGEPAAFREAGGHSSALPPDTHIVPGTEKAVKTPDGGLQGNLILT